MADFAYIRGWLDVTGERSPLLKALIEKEIANHKSSGDEIICMNLAGWFFPDYKDPGYAEYAFFGSSVYVSDMPYFRDLFKRISRDVCYSDMGHQLYVYGVFHIHSDIEVEGFRWVLENGKMIELPGSEIKFFLND